MAMTRHVERLSPLSFVMLGIAASFYFYEYMLQVSPAVILKALAVDFQAGAGVLGMISGSFFLTYTLMQIPAGLLYDKFGAHLILSASALICAAGALLFAVAGSAQMACVGRLLMGGVSAGAFVGVLYIGLRWFPTRYFAVLVGVVQFIGSVGAISGEAPLALLSRALGWRHMMLGFAGVGAVISIIVLCFLRNAPKTDTKARSPHTQPSAPATNKKADMNIPAMLALLLKNGQIWFIALYALCIWAPVIIFASLWGVPFLKTAYHIDSIKAANLCAMMWLGSAFGSILVCYFSVYLGRRRLPATLSAIVGLASAVYLIYFIPSSTLVVNILLFVIGFAAGGQALSFAIVEENVPRTISSTALGFNNMAVVCSGFLLQPLVGVLLDFFWNGHMENGIRVYSLYNYKLALLIIPLCFVIAFLAAQFGIRETFCRSRNS